MQKVVQDILGKESPVVDGLGNHESISNNPVDDPERLSMKQFTDLLYDESMYFSSQAF